MTTGTVPNYVPQKYVSWVKAASIGTGLPPAVVAAQIDDESGFNPGATSPTGAEGIAQFEPGTWSGNGCAGSAYDANAALKCYIKFMYQLLKQNHGNIRNALAAYNAGQGNLAAGYGYADAILARAGEPNGGTAGSGTGGGGGTSTTAFTSASDPECLFGLPNVDPGSSLPIVGKFLPSTSECLVKKSEGRAVVGGLVLVGGGLILGLGMVVLVAFGLKGRGKKAQQIVSVVPGLPSGGKAAVAAEAAPVAAVA